MDYFDSLKIFLILFYFINSLFKRKSVEKLTQVNIKVSKISYYSFNFKLNEKKKVPLKTWVGEGKLNENFCWRGLMFNRKVGNISKNGGEGLQKKGVGKNRGVATLKETMTIVPESKQWVNFY